MVLGAALGALPAFAWYSAAVPAGRIAASGFAGAGELWLLPALGALAVLAGAAMVSARPDEVAATARWSGAVALAAGAFALVWALRAGLDPRVTLEVVEPDGRERVAAPVALEPAAVVTPIVAGALAAVGAALSWAGWRPAAGRGR
jgi:hypothetical protein